ncbi:MAG: serine/threonine protein kinase [Candidatus Lokiarchaeota archaeon]|nr:serine/threonine protein kinase [Candidatus Lokiarchaeota archaeon]
MKALNVIKELREGDLHTLNSIERGMKKHLYVPFSSLKVYSGYTEEDLEFYLNRLIDYELINLKRTAYKGYKLRFSGYDCLALNALIKADIIEGFGHKLGVGKEADVYDVLLSNSKERAAIKIHRVGRASFHHIKRYRTYISNRKHISKLYISRLAAQREYEAMNILYSGGLSVPKPIFQNRHSIVMSFMNGELLSNINYLDKPQKILNKIFDFIYLSFNNHDIIHSDLSEFNIMVTDDLEVIIFDFPQWISSDHPQYTFYLKRDIFNIANFFRRKFKVITELNNIYEKFEI